MTTYSSVAVERLERRIAELETALRAAKAYAEATGLNTEPITDAECREEVARNHGEEAAAFVEALTRVLAGTGNTPPGDPTIGLPAEVIEALRAPGLVIDRDLTIRLADGRTLLEHTEEWRNAPSNTASAGSGSTQPSAPQDQIDRGEAPAVTLRQLSSAVRQNLAGAGADLYTIGYALDNDHDPTVIREAAARLRGHLESAEAKLSLSLAGSGNTPTSQPR